MINIIEAGKSIKRRSMEKLIADLRTYTFRNKLSVAYVRTLPDGREIWVDGDGNTSINRDTGWVQTNPDYRVRNT